MVGEGCWKILSFMQHTMWHTPEEGKSIVRVLDGNTVCLMGLVGCDIFCCVKHSVRYYFPQTLPFWNMPAYKYLHVQNEVRVMMWCLSTNTKLTLFPCSPICCIIHSVNVFLHNPEVFAADSFISSWWFVGVYLDGGLLVCTLTILWHRVMVFTPVWGNCILHWSLPRYSKNNSTQKYLYTLL